MVALVVLCLTCGAWFWLLLCLALAVSDCRGLVLVLVGIVLLFGFSLVEVGCLCWLL